ncbi:MAG: hypothetical protein SWJ54_17995 [Cyanobacteriota bacterium]|nr:hypothetical protein [Cyanobacteriota bacterium]
MSVQFLIPLLICCLALWVSLGKPLGTSNELTCLLSSILGVVCGVWFVVVAPWIMQLSLMIGLLIFTHLFLRDNFRLR